MLKQPVMHPMRLTVLVKLLFAEIETIGTAKVAVC
jgi:hypothetical protein